MKNISLNIPLSQPSNESIQVVAPFNLTPVATVETANADMVEQALVNAHTLYQDKQAWLPLHQRLSILEKTAELMSQQVDRLTFEAAQEGGKPYQDSHAEVLRAIDGVKVCIDTMRTEGGKVIPMGLNPASAGKMAFTQSEPIGVVVAVSAFNHPLNLIVHQVAPAIATGCPVIIKPARNTPLSCFNFVDILYQAGLPVEWCQALVIQDANLSTKLVADERVSFLSFIGSANVGWMLRSKLAPGARCALEHGGVAPVIVTEDANLADAAPKLAKGGFYHAGQVCVSVQRIYAHHSIAKDLANRLVAIAKTQVVGDPTLPETDIGPLITPKECKRVDDWVQEAIQQGAECLVGGNPISETCYPCTVLFNPSEASLVSQKEVFGPVICIYSYTDAEEAIQRANQLSVSFQAAIFSQDLNTCLNAYHQLNASAVMINDHTAFRVDWMPFAGLKTSGHGVGGIPYTIEEMQIQKMMVINPA